MCPVRSVRLSCGPLRLLLREPGLLLVGVQRRRAGWSPARAYSAPAQAERPSPCWRDPQSRLPKQSVHRPAGPSPPYRVPESIERWAEQRMDQMRWIRNRRIGAALSSDRRHRQKPRVPTCIPLRSEEPGTRPMSCASISRHGKSGVFVASTVFSTMPCWHPSPWLFRSPAFHGFNVRGKVFLPGVSPWQLLPVFASTGRSNENKGLSLQRCQDTLFHVKHSNLTAKTGQDFGDSSAGDQYLCPGCFQPFEHTTLVVTVQF